MKKNVFLVSICLISLLGVFPNLLLLYLLLGRRGPKLKKAAAVRNAVGVSGGGGGGGGCGSLANGDFPILLTSQCINHVLLCVTSPLDVFFLSQEGSDVAECMAFLSVKSVLMLFSVLIVSLQGLEKVYRVQNLRKVYNKKAQLWLKVVAIVLAAILSSVPLVLELILTDGQPMLEGCSVRPAVVDVAEAVFFLGCVVSVLALVAVVSLLRAHSLRVAAEGGAGGRGRDDSRPTQGITTTASAAAVLTPLPERAGDGGDIPMKSLQKFKSTSSEAPALMLVSQRAAMTSRGDGDNGDADATGNVTMMQLQELKTSEAPVSELGGGGGGSGDGHVKRGDSNVVLLPLGKMASTVNTTPMSQQDGTADGRTGPNHATPKMTFTDRGGKKRTLLQTQSMGAGFFAPGSNNTHQGNSNNTTSVIRRVSMPHESPRPLKRQRSWSGSTHSWVSPHQQREQSAHQHLLWTLGESETSLETNHSKHKVQCFPASSGGKANRISPRGLNSTASTSNDSTKAQSLGASNDRVLGTTMTTQHPDAQSTSNQTSSSFISSSSSPPASSSTGVASTASCFRFPGKRKKGREGRGGEGVQLLSVGWSLQGQLQQQQQGRGMGGDSGSSDSKPLVMAKKRADSLPYSQSCPDALDRVHKIPPPRSSSVTLQRLKTATVKAAQRGALMVTIFLVCYLPLMVSLLVLSLDNPVYETALLLEGLTLPISYVHALVCPIAVIATDQELKTNAVTVLKFMFRCRKKQAASISTT